ncbi:MAG: PAS domain S-box protein [Saprospiraceae bacterium]|nr:PAS domain S-box protein [Saprospiraceae bacterium]MCF8249665.1 PAS domain S-box protein [Saprospiraceae bacterium]MCF8279823.1 PAS domain S-box protein [Bacteroidales bacterium]MCF8312348.1 PAS domain S-box protein [Saprospiraceae bacterium]MCF8440655.1 PAS domain S-box protein [Saprospiraceae bacterium]
MAELVQYIPLRSCVTCDPEVRARIGLTEASLYAILDNIPDAIFSVDTEFHLITANKRFKERALLVTGIAFEPGDSILVQGKNQDIIDQWKIDIEKALKGDSFKVDTEYVDETEAIYRETSYTPIWQEKKIVGVSCHCKDVTESRVIKNQLIEKEVLFRTLLENSHDGIAMLSAGGRLKYISPSVGRILGYTFEEMLEIGMPSLVHPDDLGIVISFSEKLASQYGKSSQINYRMKSKPGSWRWIHCHYTNMLHEPSIKAFVANYEDITETRALEFKLENTVHQLIEADERQSSILNSLGVNIAMLNSDGIIVEVNAEWRKFADEYGFVGNNTGIGDNYVLEAKSANCHADDTAYKVGEGVRAVLKGDKKTFSMEYTCHSPLQKRWFKVIVNPLYKKDMGGAVVLHMDITDRKLTELQIEFERRNQAALINGTNDLIWSIDADMRLITANNTFLSVIKDRAGIDLNPGDNMLFSAKSIDGYKDYWTKQYKRVLSGEKFTEILHRLEPSEYWAKIFFNPIWENEKVIGAACYYRDITERKKSERLILQTQQMMAEAESRGHFGCWEFDLFDLENMPANDLRWSDEVYRIYGYEPQGCQPSHSLFYNAVHPDDRDAVREGIQKSLKDFSVAAIDHRIFMPNGEMRWVHEEARIIVNQDTGKPIKMVSTIHDISERKASEEKLLEAERNYRDIFNKASDAIYVFDAELATIVDANLMACERTGYSLEELVNCDLEMLMAGTPGYTLTDAFSHLAKAANGDTEVFEWLSKSKAGKLNLDEVTTSSITIAGRRCVLASFRNIEERKQAETNLLKSEEQYRQIVDTSQEGIVMIDSKNRISFVNDKMCEMLEYTKDEVSGKELFDFLDGETKQISLSANERRRQGKTENYDIQLITKTGRQVWTNISANPIFGKDGEFNGALAMLTDITERKQIEESLRQSNERYELVTKATNDAIWDWNLLTDEVYWSEGYESIFGYPKGKDDNSAKIWNSRIHPEDAERVKKDVQQAIDDSASNFWQGEYRYIKVDGSVANVYDQGYITYNEAGIPTRMVGAMRDITAQKQAEESLRRSNERFELVSMATNDAIWDWNLVTDERYWSEGYESIFGYSREGGGVNLQITIGRIHPDDRERIRTSWSKTLSDPTAHSWEEEYRYLRADGTVAYVYNRGYIVYDETGKPVRMVGALQDISARKNAAEQLRLSNERYELATMATKDAIWDWNINTGALSWTEGYETLFGYPNSREGLNFDTCSSRIHPDDSERVKASLRKAMFDTSTDYWQGNYRYRKADGSYAFVFNQGYIMHDEGGMPIRVVGAMQDITAQKQAAESLRISNERYELATKATNDAIWDWNLVNNEHYWTDGYELTFGYSLEKDDLSVEASLARTHPDDRERLWSIVQNAINNPSYNSWQAEYRYQRKDGAYATVFNQGYAIRKEEGGPIRMVVAMQDISSRKKAEESLLKSEANLRTIFDHADRAYVLLDKDFHILSFNTVATEWAKVVYNAEFTEGESIIAYLEEEKKEEAKRSLESVLEGNHLAHESHHRTPDGTEKWFSVRRYPVRNEDGSIIGICIATKEVTQRRQFQMERDRMVAEIVQRNKDLEQYAYIVSHNLRAPVANIVGFSDVLLNTELEDCEKQDVLEGLDVSIKRLDNVISDLNIILQVKKQMNDLKEPVQLSSLTHDIVISIGDLVEKQNAIIQIDFNEVEELHTFKSYLHSIFYNLISNSIKYRRPDVPPLIQIRSSKSEGKILLKFKDNGLGIDLKKRNGQVFGMYKRFHTEVAEGKGMGLYMVKTQVEALGGNISVKSGVNIGTEFSIVFNSK